MWIDDATPENGDLVVVVVGLGGRQAVGGVCGHVRFGNGCGIGRPRSFVYILLSIDNMPHIYLNLLDSVAGQPWLAIASRKNLKYSA